AAGSGLLKPSSVSRVCGPSSPQRRTYLQGSDPRRLCTAPWKASRLGRLLGVKAMLSQGFYGVGVPKTLGAPRHVHADTTRRGAPAGRGDSPRWTRLGSLSAAPS